MKVVIDAAQSKQQDAEYSGDLGRVMEAAGYAVANHAAAMGATYGKRVAVLVGAGNNGGDGYVAARHLARRGVAVTVHPFAPPKTVEAIQAADAWTTAGGAVAPIDAVQRSDLLVDAVFGVAFRGDLPPEVGRWKDTADTVIAIDVPSGLDATTGSVAAGALHADLTVALSNFKVGHFFGSGPEMCGRLAVAPLGLPEAQASMYLCEAADAPRPPRDRDAHKWSAGSVAVVGGSAGMAGAAVLAAKAALGFGAGAVATFVPGALATELDAAHPEIMTTGVGEGTSWEGVTAADLDLDRFDVVVVGPGLGQSATGLVTSLLNVIDQPIVLDADGLNAISASELGSRQGPAVLTPHAGEFQRLSGEEASPEAALSLSDDVGAVVLLKGPNTTVVEPGSIPWLVTTGGPELASVGTGDVLSGMIAALASRGLDGHVAARSAAYWHGVAGAILATTSSVTADRMADEIRRFAN